jgi:hypothetical protein
MSSDDVICCHGCYDGFHAGPPSLLVGVCEFRNGGPLGFVEGRFRGSHHEIVEMMMRFCAICVSTVTRLRVLESHLQIMTEIFLNSRE